MSAYESPSIWANDRLRLVVTAKCNLDCVYCHNEGQAKANRFLGRPLFEHLLQILENCQKKPLAVTFSGGEPLLHSELSKYIREIGVHIPNRTLVTNGILLSPQKLNLLLESGISKIRLGIDSLASANSRPSTRFPSSFNIRSVIELLKKGAVPFEINVVISSFNQLEIPQLIAFCLENRISAKFFEQVEIDLASNAKHFQCTSTNPVLSEEEFWRECQSVDSSLHPSISAELGVANSVASSNDVSIRYCRFLCNYGLCSRTGTRVDPLGSVYTCLTRLGAENIIVGESVQTSMTKITRAKQQGCGSDVSRLLEAV